MASGKFFYTYVLKSESDGKVYIGSTRNLRRRVAEHRRGSGSRTTALRGPFTLIYYEACVDWKKAVARERYFKKGYGRKFLKNRLYPPFSVRCRVGDPALAHRLPASLSGD